MRVGTHLHAALEAEVSETVEVQISTREDAWAVRLLNTLRGLHQLLETGLARELYVFGRIQVTDVCSWRGVANLAVHEHRLKMHSHLHVCMHQPSNHPLCTNLQITLYARSNGAFDHGSSCSADAHLSLLTHGHLTA